MVEIKSELLAPCGLYCGWCPFYLGTSKKYPCEGCKSREECSIRDCAKERQLQLCTFCQGFPCQKLYSMYGKMNEFFDEIQKEFPQGIKRG